MSRVIRADSLETDYAYELWNPGPLSSRAVMDSTEAVREEAAVTDGQASRGDAPGKDAGLVDGQYAGEVLVETAREEARAMIRNALREAERMREEGYRAGYEEGRRAGLTAGREEAENLLGELKLILEQVFNARDAAFERWRDVLVDISLGVARRIVGQEISARPETVLEMLKRALAQTKEGDELVIRLNPEDLAVAEKSSEVLFVNGTDRSKLTFAPDRSIERGGAVIESTHGTVDATIPTMMERIGSVVRRSVREDDQG